MLTQKYSQKFYVVVFLFIFVTFSLSFLCAFLPLVSSEVDPKITLPVADGWTALCVILVMITFVVTKNFFFFSISISPI
jgi:hypothetical protein